MYLELGVVCAKLMVLENPILLTVALHLRLRLKITYEGKVLCCGKKMENMFKRNQKRKPYC